MTTLDGTSTTLSARAQSLLGAPENLIDGAWERGEGSGRLASHNPATAEVLAELPTASVEQAERAIAAARRAFDSGPWRDTSPRDRSDLLHGLADLMERN